MAAQTGRKPTARRAPRPDREGAALSRRVAYLVLGMHRSGTSLVTQLLSLAGAQLPKEVMPGDEHNEGGYFEPWRIALLNDERLREGGSAWDDVFAFPFRPLGRRLERRWMNRAIELFEAEYGEAPCPLLKDPRITVLLPVWREVLADLELDARCVIPVRHPMAVAGSLARRNGFPVEKSLLLWTAYMLAAEAYSRDMPRAFVGYDAILEDWRGELARIEAAHGAKLPKLTARAAKAIDEALRPDLRHNVASEAAEMPGWAGELAGRTLSWFEAALRGEAPDRAALDAVAEALRTRQNEFGMLVSPVSRELDALRAENLELRRRLEAEREAAKARERELIETMERDRKGLETGWKSDVERQAAESARELAAAAEREAELRAENGELRRRLDAERDASRARERELLDTMERDRKGLETGWKSDVERQAAERARELAAATEREAELRAALQRTQEEMEAGWKADVRDLDGLREERRAVAARLDAILAED